MIALYTPPSRLMWCLWRALTIVALAILSRAAFGAPHIARPESAAVRVSEASR